ncbi:uncharacterized protein LOC114540377 [Dendronephthya gigantea]|uniref:uncharacterized protein LOC114540377 n=1 Tax=Dendronephthya gigantea TaxID=151771 RepID=UPI00106DC81B|nr:uncharacterized protein LOC114540377 [Dendronephthya gigantea]
MAAINFKKAADFYRSVHSSKLNHKVVYMESLIGLAKSRVLCNDLENALRACEEGLGIEPEQTTSALSEENLELLYLTMKCAFLLITRSSLPDERVHLKHCYERFYTILGEVDYFRPKADTGMEDDEFFAILKQCKFCFVISVIRECISFHLAKSEEERMNARQRAKSLENSFNVNIFNTNTRECRKSDVEEIQRVRRHCRSWIGQLLVIIGETENAVIHLKKSLAGFFVPDFTGSIIPLDEIIPLLDAITATNAASSSAQESQSLFQQTLELCRDEYLKVNDNPFPLLNFFRNLGNHFVDGGRTWEATHAYNAGLEVVQNLISDATDQVNARNEMMLHLANVHRLQALENTGKGEVEESRLAEKYYKFENGNGTEKSSIHKNIMYANFLCDKGRFEEAIVVVNKAIEADDKLWSTTVICSFSERVLYGSDVKNYIESDGELLTKMGNLAYTTLVCAYVQLGNGREACKALDTLLKNGEDLPPSAIYTTSCLSHLIGFCQKYLLSLVKDRMKLSFPDSEFTLSPENLAKLYYELDPTRKLSSLRFIADALVMMGRGDESISYYREFLLLMDRCEGVLDKSFDEQHAIISHLSFPESRYVYLALGSVMLEHQDKIDDAIACYQHCLVLAMGLSDDTYQDSVAILTALYQTKALTNGKEDQTIYQKWMDKAQECFQNLVSKNVKMTSFVQTTFASFLLRTEQFAEAISHFEQLLDIETNSSIAYCQVGIPLFGVHMAREIKARGKVCVQLKVHIYYLIALAYFQCGKIEKAQESALQMEEYVENISSTPYYLISRSLLAYAYKETGNERKAMEILKTVLESEPDNVAVKLALEECAAIEEATSSCNQI